MALLSQPTAYQYATSVGLTKGQTTVFEQLTAKQDTFTIQVLKGFAGTGKTTLTAALVSYIEMRKERVLVVAPTHKALREIRMKLPEGITTLTLASLLNKKRRRDQNGGWSFESDGNIEGLHRRNEIKGTMGGYLIIDEASMVSEKDAKDIVQFFRIGQKHATFKGLLLVGDPRQLAPVNEEQTQLMGESGTYIPDPLKENIYSVQRLGLTKVVRHDGGILNLATAIRERDFGLPSFGSFREKDVILETREAQWLASWLEKCEDFSARALAYTNKRVKTLNDAALLQRYGTVEEAEKIHVGQRFLTVEGAADKEGSLIFPSTTEILVIEMEERVYDVNTLDLQRLTKKMNEGKGKTKKKKEEEPLEPMPYLNFLEINAQDAGMNLKGTILVIDPKHHDYYKEIVKSLKALAVARLLPWVTYYEFVELFTAVQPAYALTIHKSQGSTFREVFLDIADVVQHSFRDLEMQNRLAYVGVSRASRMLYINL
jgi:exodeoxyribonuclease-5